MKASFDTRAEFVKEVNALAAPSRFKKEAIKLQSYPPGWAGTPGQVWMSPDGTVNFTEVAATDQHISVGPAEALPPYAVHTFHALFGEIAGIQGDYVGAVDYADVSTMFNSLDLGARAFASSPHGVTTDIFMHDMTVGLAVRP